MFTHAHFDVTILRSVNARALRWPGHREVDDESNPAGNRQYVDLRGMSWDDAIAVFELEGQLIERIATAATPEREADTIEEELCESEPNLFGLDIGVASTVAALAAAKCVPFSSCNAAAFGGIHAEAFPLVAFFARQRCVGTLMAAAMKAGVGLRNRDEGYLVVFADDIRRLRGFAAAILRERDEFDAAARQKRVASPSGGEPSQLSFQLDSKEFPEQ